MAGSLGASPVSCIYDNHAAMAAWVEGWCAGYRAAGVSAETSPIKVLAGSHVKRDGAVWLPVELLAVEAAAAAGLSHAEVADALGRSPQAVRIQACRLRRGRAPRAVA
ncbi:MAG: hypothetical protein AB7P02_25180 [Alphaproteobacteria bacterium]